MAAIGESRATLRLFGDDLDPDEITRILGKPPTASERKGNVIRSKTTGRERIARTGSWRLEAPDCQPEDIDGQVAQILSGMTNDLDKWQLMATKYRVDMFCGLFMQKANEGLTLSPITIMGLGQRGISIGFDIYAPDTEALSAAMTIGSLST